MQYDYLIVGAGLFGAVFAHAMRRAGRRVLVIDRRSHLGGNIYTEKRQGIDVHLYGAHIFHTSNRRVWNFVQGLGEWNHYINSPMARYGEEIYNLPFNMNTFSKLWNIHTPAQARAILEEQRREMEGREPENLEEQAIALVGRDIYEKLIKGYTKKQWGRECRQLPAFIIRRLPLRFTYDNNYFSDPYQGIPKQGYTALAEKLLEGVELHLGVSYEEFLVTKPADCRWKKLVYTGPIDEFFHYQLGALEYRSLEFVHSWLPEEENYQGNAVVNYTSEDVPYTRIIEHKHFNFGQGPGTIITEEYSKEWAKGDEPYYPVNDHVNQSLYTAYRELARSRPDVIFGGRLGAYRYYDMDKVIEAAWEALEQEGVSP